MKKTAIVFFVILSIPGIMFLNYLLGDKDFSFDLDIYPKDYEVNTEHGLIKVNKENCVKYGWK